MTDRRFYYTEFRLRVVSSEPVDSVDALQRVLNDQQLGTWCSREPLKQRNLDGLETAVMLRGMGCQPDLFGLDNKGNDLEEE